ncbi:MAG: DNA replication/repair protein RecF [Xanthomonadales bacterium]|nr:DNA replication/repair protein RecF [Xanthomonadales bacterium]
MQLKRLCVDGVRNLQQVDLEFNAGRSDADLGDDRVSSSHLNLVLGANGSGKSSLLESIHLLAHGRSFRSGAPDDLVQRGASGLDIHSHWSVGTGQSQRLGMSRRDRSWHLRVNDADVASLAEFVQHSAAVAVTPDSQLLVTGPAEWRRRHLDWLLFHVEHEFLDHWRRYQRALKQRNLVLRSHGDSESLAAWEAQMASAGEAVSRFRAQALALLEQQFRQLAGLLIPSLAVDGLLFRPGWPSALSLAEALAAGRESDQERGFSQRGPHRADWRLRFADGLDQDQLSRGQAKLVAICCLLAQVKVFHAQRGIWPVMLVDDLASELDPEHQVRLLGWLAQTQAQIFITGTELQPRWPDRMIAAAARFHVEQGRVTRLL